jgi:hypothetical protein
MRDSSCVSGLSLQYVTSMSCFEDVLVTRFEYATLAPRASLASIQKIVEKRCLLDLAKLLRDTDLPHDLALICCVKQVTATFIVLYHSTHRNNMILLPHAPTHGFMELLHCRCWVLRYHAPYSGGDFQESWALSFRSTCGNAPLHRHETGDADGVCRRGWPDGRPEAGDSEGRNEAELC